MEKIQFYKLKEPYGDFSNFARFSFTYHGNKWQTSEHAYQAAKYTEKEIIEKILNAKTPRIAADIGKDLNNGFKIREDWESIKVNRMQHIIYAKFVQNKNLKSLLLSTGNAEISEHTNRDFFWGDGLDGTGKNMLGIVLMEVRELLRNK